MSGATEFLLRSILIGVGATIVLDLWSLIGPRVFGYTPPNWALVGRWIGHMRQNQFVHERIAAASPVPGEAAIGWTAHYAIGIFYALLLVAVFGLDWARAPTPLPAFIVGYVALAAPFLVMQPGMGSGFFASRTPKPWLSRLGSVLGHTMFSVGLYVSALLAARLIPA